MAQGAYDHPTYLTRQMLMLGRTTAGANGTSCQVAFPSAMRIRNVAVMVITAGTSTDTVTIQNGTTSIGNIVLGTGAALTTATSSDLNSTLAVGTSLNIKNGTDATRVIQVTAEAHLDQGASFS